MYAVLLLSVVVLLIFTYYFTVLVLKSYSKSRRVLKTISLPTVEPFYAPPLIGGGIKRCFCLSVCLSVAYIWPKSRTERHRKTKIGTEVAHITPDSDTTFKVKRPLYSARP